MRRRERVSVVWQVRRRRLFNICQCVTIGYRTLGHFQAMSAAKKADISYKLSGNLAPKKLYF